MPPRKTTAPDEPAELAARLAEALQRERIVPRFVDSYVAQHGRYGLQVHASLYRDLLALIHREALIAASVQALQIATGEPDERPSSPKIRNRASRAAAFRRKYLAALVRQQKWTAGDALDFHKDLRVYEQVLEHAASGRRRKPFEAANHPFVDRCAFLLDPSFLEIARLAASRALTEVQALTAHVATNLPPPSNKFHGIGKR